MKEKDYLSRVPDEEIAGWIVAYLSEIGWGLNSPYKNLENIEDMLVEKSRGNVIVTLYFKHPYKQHSHQDYIHYYSDIPGVDITESVSIPFYGNSYNMEVIGLFSGEVQKYAFEESCDVEEDLKRYWQEKMYWKFKDEDYLDNLNTHEERLKKDAEELADASEIGL